MAELELAILPPAWHAAALVAKHDGWVTYITENGQRIAAIVPLLALTPSADLPACRDENPAHQAVLAAAYPDPPEYQHPEEPQDADR